MDTQHHNILQRIASVPCRNNKHGWTDQTRLHTILDILQDNPYQPVMQGDFSWVFAKHPIDQLPENVILISTHVDVVPSIKDLEMFSQYNAESDELRGTYDNAATNAACVIAMLEHDLPENVIFAFNVDEETGRCNGAKEVVKHLHSYGKKVFPVALDVTEERTPYALYSIENTYLNDRFLAALAYHLYKQEQDADFSQYSGRFVLKDKSQRRLVQNLPVQSISPYNAWFDEGAAYGRMQLEAFSFCLPLTGGAMHSGQGCYTLGEIFEGYTESLVSLTYILTNTHTQELQALLNSRKSHVDSLVDVYEKEQEALKNRPSYYQQYNFFGSDSSHGYISTPSYLSDDAYAEQMMENLDAPVGLEDEAEEYMEWLLEQAIYYDISGQKDFERETMQTAQKLFPDVVNREECEDYPANAFYYTHSSAHDIDYYGDTDSQFSAAEEASIWNDELTPEYDDR